MDGNITRRSTLKALGGITGAGIIGSAAFTGSAAAVTEVGFNTGSVNDVENDDGVVTHFSLGVEGNFSWDGLDAPAKAGTVSLRVSKDGETWQGTGISETFDINGTHGTRDFTLPSVDLTEIFSDDYYSVPEDGTEETIPTYLKLEVTVTDTNNEEVKDSDTTTMDLLVTNQEAYVAGEGTATGTAGGFDQTFESHNGEGILYIRHGSEVNTFLLDVSEWGDASVGTNANWAIALSGISVNGTETAQVKYQGGEVIIKAVQQSEDRWVSAEVVPEDINIEASDSGTLRLDVPTKYFPNTDYKVMADASAGGEYGEHLYISSTEGKGWSEGFDGGTENYISVNASEE